MSAGATSRLMLAAAIATVIACLALRITSPYDLWDQTQPKTLSYTSDIVAHGRWILPIERGEFPATKPPLYNWLAAPAVALMGYDSELAHKLPSVLAMLLCAAAIYVVGKKVGGERGGFTGAAAVIAFASNYPIYKLGWLARPDMVLTLWLVIGWIAATAAIDETRSASPRRARWVLVFWLCVGLAALTKGPAALVLPIYAIVQARIVRGRWSEARLMGWWWGVPLAMVVVGWWAVAAWLTNPEHFRTVLWGSEIWGRVTGLGPEGNQKGPLGWFTDVYYMPYYYVARFAPWSILSLMAMADLLKRDATAKVRAWRRETGSSGEWLVGAMTFIILMVIVFTISTGKRADYIAAAFAPGSVLAAWRLSRFPRRWPVLLALVLGACSIAGLSVGRTHGHSPCEGFAAGIDKFVNDVTAAVKSEPMPVVTWRFGPLHIQAMAGVSVPERDDAGVRQALESGQGFWVVGGLEEAAPTLFSEWMRTVAPDRTVREVLHSQALCRNAAWPEQAFLYRVEPRS